jgi:ATP-dependent DNA helicase RecG
VPGTVANDIDVEAVRHFATLAAPRGVSWQGDVSAVLDRLHLLRDGGLTVGALLLFGRDPERTLPQASVRLRVTRGAVEEGEPIGGGLLHVIEETVRQVQLRLRRQADRSGLVRREVDELPLVAVREAVVNAIAHRDYRSTAPIQVRLDDDKLQIWNPGHLPEPLTVDALRRDHPSVPPNPRIARALYLAGFVEEWGTGTLRVVASMAEQGNAEPVFDAELGGFSVTLPLRRGVERSALTERQTALLARLGGATGSLRVADLSTDLAVSTRTVQNELVALEALGLVVRVGRGKAARWTRARP